MGGHKSSGCKAQQGVNSSRTCFKSVEIRSFPDGFGPGFLVCRILLLFL